MLSVGCEVATEHRQILLSNFRSQYTALFTSMKTQSLLVSDRQGGLQEVTDRTLGSFIYLSFLASVSDDDS
jgi:hypothetical protein